MSRWHYMECADGPPICRARWRHHTKNQPNTTTSAAEVTCKQCIKRLGKKLRKVMP